MARVFAHAHMSIQVPAKFCCIAACSERSMPLLPMLFSSALTKLLRTGIWSQIKRAPKAAKKRKVYEVAGPAKEGAMPLKERARQIVSYFKK